VEKSIADRAHPGYGAGRKRNLTAETRHGPDMERVRKKSFVGIYRFEIEGLRDSKRIEELRLKRFSN